MDLINQLGERDLCWVRLFGEGDGFGLVKSVDIEHQKITFSKFNELRDGKLRGNIENITLNYIKENFEFISPARYFDMCRRFETNPDLTYEDFFKPGDLILTGLRSPGVGELIGTVNRVTQSYHEILHRELYSIVLDNPKIITPEHTVQLFNSYEFSVGIKELAETNQVMFYIVAGTKILREEWVMHQLQFLETYHDYSINGFIV